MSRPRLLHADDSEAILAFSRAALGRWYEVETAANGREALERVRALRPALLLLDLSMPELDGAAVVARLREDPELASLPIIIASSERARGEALVGKGAVAFLPKPLRADVLVSTVDRVLADARAAEARTRLQALVVCVGGLRVAVPLDCVRLVLRLPATQPLPGSPSWLNRFFVLHGEPVRVLDLARRFGVEHEVGHLLRQLVVVEVRGRALALCVDQVEEPREFSADALRPREALGGSGHPALREALRALLQTPEGFLPLLSPEVLVTPNLLQELARSSDEDPPAA
ncbi:chemotaxis protein CheW [Vitiosangium sp. GDMCC 1.1324]|uniref:chemotaxis protein CheW n=1 Tax=Vitiosangium sp. (strain GDMCC 1.1324) TaxID=2138576 RepID=UPI000D35608B|nr:chemotaxis protein CheW [Vitiosangium sp. GDMCC 1.1324]PTL84435.1 chemotaxis protein CheW [Vitiosangium sp. GDMCC 1.1324]